MTLQRLRFPVWRYPRPPDAGDDGALEDLVVEEAPLRLRVDGQDLGVVMRTPGDDEALAVGFALGEGILGSPEEIDRVRLCPGSASEGVVAEIDLVDAGSLELGESLRSGLISSGCGVCGREMIQQVLARRPTTRDRSPTTMGREAFQALPDKLRENQPLFGSTGGCHGAALFTLDGELVGVAEDVGRHNAVDKVLGRAALEGRWPAPPVLVVSSRASFDILQKAVVAGIEIVGAVSAPSAQAVRLAVAAGVTLVRFVRPGELAVYAGRSRVPFLGPL